MATRKPRRTEWKQINGKWTRSLGSRGVRVRLFQITKNGSFFRALWIPGRGKSRKYIGTKDKAEAERIGRELLSALLLEGEVAESGSLPLGYLWERYQRDCPAFLDNTPTTRANDANHAAVLVAYFGADCDVRGLTESDQQSFTSKRLAGGIVLPALSGRKKRITKPVRGRSVEVETQLLHSMLRWAVTVRVRKGQRLLDRNPLEGVKRPHELNPKRPMASVERFTATRKAILELAEAPIPSNPKWSPDERSVAEKRHEDFRRNWWKLDMALVLAEATGRRLGSIRQLRWDDWDFERCTVRWRGVTDKKGKEWLVPIPESLLAEVKSYRVKMGGMFGGFMFPDPNDISKATDRHEFRTWLEVAEKKAGLPKLDGALWHAYRRGWASSRKHMPVSDVAAVGGWKDIGTLLKCYTQADSDTMLAVMESPKKISERAVSR